MLCSGHRYGGVAELAYAAVLKSVAARIVGSNPTAPTIPLFGGETAGAASRTRFASLA